MLGKREKRKGRRKILDYRFWDLIIPKSRIENRESAFTMIETLIYIAIIGAVLTGFVGYSINISNAREKAYVVEEVQANARIAIDLISQKIRTANSVNVGASTFGSDPGVLSLEMDTGSVDPTIFDLDADDGVLQMSEGVGSAISVTSDEVNVTNLVFTDLTGTGTKENVKIEITVEFGSSSGGQIYTYTKSLRTSVSLRQ
jgi:type II secretory pathway pseudopilin PulG